MMKKRFWGNFCLLLLCTLLIGGFLALPGPAGAVVPVVKTVPWVASNPLIPHDTWSGKQITLKGTCDVQGADFQYSWDFGDGSPPATGTVSNRYAIEATHAYTGNPGDIFTARLTVEDTGTGETGSSLYYVVIEDQNLPVEVNVAIDEGLWYLHKTQYRYASGSLDFGHWNSGSGYATSGYYAVTAANLNAFFVNGHLETGDASNPYAETVQRGMRRLFQMLATFAIGSQTYPAPIGTVNPDSNGNGYGVQVNNTDPPYQGGSFMDAIVASGTPDAVTVTGQAPSGGNPGILGRTYRDILQDMVDAYAYGQGHAGTYYGGWRYSWNYGCNNCNSDNSTNQWAAIGMIAAEREFGVTVPSWVKTANINSINLTQNAAGYFGYSNSTSPIWGPYAVTPSGMVQMAMVGIGQGDLRWDRSETYIYNSFCNPGSYAYNNIKNYYYGLFSFTKAMLLHDDDGDGTAEPITLLGGTLDWYAAQQSLGDPCDGVARTLVNDQAADGYWRGHNYSSAQYPFETAWAIIMLNRTVFASGVPVAVAEAIPNPAVAGQTIILDGSGSFHQDAEKSIVSWEWDLDNDGGFDDATGPFTNLSFPAVGNYPVGLRVTDDAGETDDTVVTVRITTPPIAPTADANGPYVLCPQAQPWFLDGTGSVNPDEGVGEPGQPGDTIQEYAWDLDGDGQFDDAFGAQPDVTAFFQAIGTGSYLIRLRVTDTTATSFPSSNFGNLSDTASAQVFVNEAADPQCVCVDDLTALAKDGKVQLTWSDTDADHFNVYRSTTQGGPYVFLGFSTYPLYLDLNVVNGTTYYYVVRPAALNGDELCQSNEVIANPLAYTRPPRRR